ncbi:MAG: DNA internalization-related competence protein ComEC/Rec2 [Gammaproteobacteria bacterium]
MGPYLASAVLGQLVLPLLPALPPFWWSLLAASLLLLLGRWRRAPFFYWPVPALLTFALSVHVAGGQLAREIPGFLESRALQVEGVVTGLPEQDRYGGWRFRLEPLRIKGIDHAPGGLWQLSLRAPEMPLPGSRCTLTVRLKRPHGNANPGGFDYEAWLLSEGITATGSARQPRCGPAPALSVDGLRLSLREHFLATFQDQAAMAGVVLALMTGDRALVPDEVWERYAATGVIHLMAISGMHITLIAIVAAWVCLRLLRLVPGLGLLVPLHQPALLAGLLVAFGYSLVAGWSVPTQRTLVMLLVIAAAHWGQRRLPALQVLGLAMLLVLLWWPLAVHAVGFWLSFGAVALLMLIGRSQAHLPAWQQALRLQFLLSVLLLPPTVWFFERASWVSPFANLLAVPVVTFVAVPLGLLGLLAWPVSPDLANLFWGLAVQVMSVLDALLAQFQSWPHASVDLSLPGRSGLAWVVLATICLFQPWQPRLRLLAPLFLLPVILVQKPPFPGALRVTVMDVGQGLSVLLEIGHYRLLYDTGAAFGAQDAGRNVILPALRQSGIRRLDRVLLSHDDIDHTGGASSILARLPVGDLLGAWPDHLHHIKGIRHAPCRAGQEWQVDGWTFAILAPAPDGIGMQSDNDRSCVLRVSKGRAAVLLPGDMEGAGELMLLGTGARVQSDVLLLGHHGAAAGSTAPWLAAVGPRLAIASAGYRNHFGHPAPAVRQRVLAAGASLLETAHTGQIVMELRATGEISRLHCRQVAGRYWWAHGTGSATP